MIRATIFIFICFCGFSHIIAQNVEVLTFVDNYATDSISSSTPLRAKSLRKFQNQGGVIEINYTSTIADTLKQAIEIAVQLWEDCLPLNTHIELNVAFVSTIVNDVEVAVPYIPNNGYLYPMSYYRNFIMAYPSYNDGTISFSESVNWCCSYSENHSGNQKMLSTAMLRAIAITLGFGTTVVQNNTGSVFFGYASNVEYSPFEHLVFNDANQALTSIGRGRKNRDNLALHSYSETDSVLWVNTGNSSYKLYAPTPFERNKSLIYLKEASSLMHYKMPIGSYYMDIDSQTISIIKAIGWDVNVPMSISIYCNDIPTTGIASAYDTYLFEINNDIPSITSLYWEYLAKASDGKYYVKKSQNGGQTFSISPSSYLLSSSINPEGDIDGIIQLTYTLNGVDKTIQSKCTFECSPKILDFYNQQIHNNGYLTYYDYSFSVAYRGAQSVTLGIEQEYSSYYDIVHIYEPFLAHAYISLLSRGNTVWIDVSVENEYGSDMQTIEIPVQSFVKSTEIKDFPFSCDNVNHINVYSDKGVLLRNIKSLSELSEFKSCSLILQYMGTDDKPLYTRKVHLK